MLTYVASPYSNPVNKIKEMRYVAVTKFMAEGLKQGHLLFGSITYCHQMAQLGQMPTDAAYWQAFNHKWLDRCDNLLIYGIDGWNESLGVTEEVQYMVETLNKPCYLWTCEPTAPNYETDVLKFWQKFPLNCRRIVTNAVGHMQIISREKADALDRNTQAAK